jgi:hypothetical protein
VSVLTHTPTPSKVFDEQVAEHRDDLDRDYSGWFCIATAPWPCPAPGCDVVVEHMTAAHLILVWPRKDDHDMLEIANDAQRLGRAPRVVEYELALGPCIPYDAWARMGGPVHGVAPRPANVPYRKL